MIAIVHEGGSESSDSDTMQHDMDAEPSLGAHGDSKSPANGEVNGIQPPGRPNRASAESNSLHTASSRDLSDIDGTSPAIADRKDCVRMAMRMDVSGFTTRLPMCDQVRLIKASWNYLLAFRCVTVVYVQCSEAEIEQGTIPARLAGRLSNPFVRQLLPVFLEFRIRRQELYFLTELQLLNPNVEHLTSPVLVQEMYRHSFGALERFLGTLPQYNGHVAPPAARYNAMQARIVELLVVRRNIVGSCDGVDGLLSMRKEPCVESCIRHLLEEYRDNIWQ
jgi:hypothetical protein